MNIRQPRGTPGRMSGKRGRPVAAGLCESSRGKLATGPHGDDAEETAYPHVHSQLLDGSSAGNATYVAYSFLVERMLATQLNGQELWCTIYLRLR